MKTLQERFWLKVSKTGPDQCWNWKGSLKPRGYGALNAGRRGEGVLYAHRVSFQLHFGPIPECLSVLHKCDNRKCVNPSHLFLGTAKDNSRDMVAKNRESSGERHGGSKLKSPQVRQIRVLHAKGSTATDLGSKYGVHRVTITNIVKRKTWRKAA